jgi:hypothetical protein
MKINLLCSLPKTWKKKKYPKNILSLNFGPKGNGAYRDDFSFDDRAESLEKFGGAFDGNDIGVFLFGSDPRNTRSVSYLGKKVPENYAQIDTWQFIYDQNRRFINVGFDGIYIPVFSIHATCKQLLLFNRFSQDLMIKRFLKISEKHPTKKIYFRVFFYMGIKKIVKLFNQ